MTNSDLLQKVLDETKRANKFLGGLLEQTMEKVEDEVLRHNKAIADELKRHIEAIAILMEN